jgi:hypothetical protein
MHTTKLPSGRPSISCLRLRSYSDAGIPGVTSPGLTVPSSVSDARRKGRERKVKVGSGDVHCGRWALAHRGGYGILRWVGQRWTVWLVGAVELE